MAWAASVCRMQQTGEGIGSTGADRAQSRKQQLIGQGTQGRKPKGKQQIRQAAQGREQKAEQSIGQGNRVRVSLRDSVGLIGGTSAKKVGPR